MKPPIIIVEARQLIEIFESVELATHYLEPIDVANGEYEAFDAAGRRLSFTVDTPDKNPIATYWGPIGLIRTDAKIELRDDFGTDEPDLLSYYIRKSLEKIGIDAKDEGLNELILLAGRHFLEKQ